MWLSLVWYPTFTLLIVGMDEDNSMRAERNQCTIIQRLFPHNYQDVPKYISCVACTVRRLAGHIRMPVGM